MKSQIKKGFTLVEIMIVVVIIGLLAAMAIPAFDKVRTNAREKTIVNNLRVIASAGQQYILSEGVNSVSYASLLDEGWLTAVAPAAGEDYTTLTQVGAEITISVTSTDTDVGASGVVVYTFSSDLG
jgi:type IV pilus assembly protein PilA